MTKLRKTSIIIALSIIAFLCAIFAFGQKGNSVQAETTGVFTATGGSYQLGTRADKTVDGLPLTITVCRT